MNALISRRDIVAAAAVSSVALTVPACAHPAKPSQWEALMDNYKLCMALRISSEKFGPLKKAYDKHDTAKRDLAERFGKVITDTELSEKTRLSENAYDEMHSVEDIHWDLYSNPAEEAARQLSLCPAPSIAALQQKIDVIIEHELDNDSEMPRDPWEIVLEDHARLRRNA